MKIENLCSNGVAYYTQRDVILYALGIGCGSGSCNKRGRYNGNGNGNGENDYDLRFVYENHSRRFTPFPTFPLVLLFRAQVAHVQKRQRQTGGDEAMSKLIHNFFGMPIFPTQMMMQNMNMFDQLLRQNSLLKNQQNKDHTNLSSSNHNIGSGNDQDVQIKAIIHLGERYRLHRDIPNAVLKPERVKMKSQVVSIQLKRIGIIVVTETQYFIMAEHNFDCQKSNETRTSVSTPDSSQEQQDEVEVEVEVEVEDEDENDNELLLLATSQSTTLYITNKPMKGDLSDSIFNKTYISTLSIPSFISSSTTSSRTMINTLMKDSNPNGKVTQYIPYNQALIYRLSGDTNPIHVVATDSDGSISSTVNKGTSKTTESSSSSSSSSITMERPILHGLCTLGYAVHAVMQYCHDTLFSNDSKYQYCNKVDNNDNEFKVDYVSCNFVKPVFVGDRLETLIWIYHNSSKDYDDVKDVKKNIQQKVHLHLLFQVKVKRSHEDVIAVDQGVVEITYESSSRQLLRSKI